MSKEEIIFMNVTDVMNYMNISLRTAYRHLERIRIKYQKEPKHPILFSEFFEYFNVREQHIPKRHQKNNSQEPPSASSNSQPSQKNTHPFPLNPNNPPSQDPPQTTS